MATNNFQLVLTTTCQLTLWKPEACTGECELAGIDHAGEKVSDELPLCQLGLACRQIELSVACCAEAHK